MPFTSSGALSAAITNFTYTSRTMAVRSGLLNGDGSFGKRKVLGSLLTNKEFTISQLSLFLAIRCSLVPTQFLSGVQLSILGTKSIILKVELLVLMLMTGLISTNHLSLVPTQSLFREQFFLISLILIRSVFQSLIVLSFRISNIDLKLLIGLSVLCWVLAMTLSTLSGGPPSSNRQVRILDRGQSKGQSIWHR